MPSARTRVLSVATFVLLGLAPSSPADAAVAQTYMQINIAGQTKYGGNADAADHIANSVNNSGAHNVSINEICVHQMERLASLLPGHQAIYQQTLDYHVNCPRGFGNGILLKKVNGANPASRAERYPFNAQPGHREKKGYMCAIIDSPVHRFCTAHLEPEDAAIREAQASQLADRIRTSLDAGTPITVGGDFNTTPENDTMNHFYHSEYAGNTGFGRMREVDGNCFDRRVNDSSCNEDTLDRNNMTDVKVDYIFVSRGHWGISGGDATDSVTSDHHPLYGYVGRNF